MKLKGNYDAATSYSVGDIVIYDGGVYYKYKTGPAGSGSPKDTHEWNRLEQPLDEIVLLMMDAVGIATASAGASAEAALEQYFINDQTLILKAGEGDSEKSYAITVDASGDTPDLAVAEVVEEDEGGDE